MKPQLSLIISVAVNLSLGMFKSVLDMPTGDVIHNFNKLVILESSNWKVIHFYKPLTLQ